MTSTQPAFPFRDGDVLSYTPRVTHARSSTAIVETTGAWDDLRALDVYWASDRTVLTSSELATASLRFNLADFTAVPSEHSLTAYHPDDRQIIHGQAGRPRYFLRTGASPDLATQLEHAEHLLRDAEEDLASAIRTKAGLEARVADLRVRVRLAPASTRESAPAGVSA